MPGEPLAARRTISSPSPLSSPPAAAMGAPASGKLCARLTVSLRDLPLLYPPPVSAQGAPSASAPTPEALHHPHPIHVSVTLSPISVTPSPVSVTPSPISVTLSHASSQVWSPHLYRTSWPPSARPPLGTLGGGAGGTSAITLTRVPGCGIGALALPQFPRRLCRACRGEGSESRVLHDSHPVTIPCDGPTA